MRAAGGPGRRRPIAVERGRHRPCRSPGSAGRAAAVRRAPRHRGGTGAPRRRGPWRPRWRRGWSGGHGRRSAAYPRRRRPSGARPSAGRTSAHLVGNLVVRAGRSCPALFSTDSSVADKTNLSRIAGAARVPAPRPAAADAWAGGPRPSCHGREGPDLHRAADQAGPLAHPGQPEVALRSSWGPLPGSNPTPSSRLAARTVSPSCWSTVTDTCPGLACLATLVSDSWVIRYRMDLRAPGRAGPPGPARRRRRSRAPARTAGHAR